MMIGIMGAVASPSMKGAFVTATWIRSSSSSLLSRTRRLSDHRVQSTFSKRTRQSWIVHPQAMTRSRVTTAFTPTSTTFINDTKPFTDSSHSEKKHHPCTDTMPYQVYLAVGSNLGDCYQNIADGLKLLCDPQLNVPGNNNEETTPSPASPPVQWITTSWLYETAPMYVLDQPSFWNGAVQITTHLSPIDLLRRIKHVEQHYLGRNVTHGLRNGPRPVDLDILFYQQRVVEREDMDSNARNGDDEWKPLLVQDPPHLMIPHVSMAEREFVLQPLCDLKRDLYHPLLNVTVEELYHQLKQQSMPMMTSTTNTARPPPAVRVLPLPRGRLLRFHKTAIIMGIVNVTPDSFSDGGKLYDSVDVALQQALDMVKEGAEVIDIGGESTRPGAKEVAIDEDLQRTIPLIRKLRQVSDVCISIDTRHAVVARAAVEAGADIVNDVSGGTFDADMLSTVAELGVPIILMHMRGTPETMQTLTDYDDVIENVAEELLERSRAAEARGIPKWLQVLDPGIGFAKDMRGNLSLLNNLGKLRSLLNGSPLLVGTSRKGFIGRITGEEKAEERDYGTVAANVAALCIEQTENKSDDSDVCTILRVHNVRATKQALSVLDALKSSTS